MSNGDPRFPYPRFLKVPFVFVPHGNPLPLEWMAAHPHHVTIPGVFIPHPPAEADMALEPQPGAEGQAEPPPAEPTYLVEIDYAGNFIARPVAPLTPQPAPAPEPPSPQPQDLDPGQWPRPPTPADPPPGPMLYPHQTRPRPDYLRRVPPPEPRRAENPQDFRPGLALSRGMNIGMDLCTPEGTRNLMRQTTQKMADMERFSGPVTYPTMHMPEALSAAVHAGMQHLAAHQGDVVTAIASVKAANAAGHATKPTPLLPPPPRPDPRWRERITDKVSTPITAEADLDIASTTTFHPRGSNAIGATIGGMVGEVLAGSLAPELGPLDPVVVLGMRYAGRKIGSTIERAIKSVIVHASTDGDSNAGDKPASGQDQSSGSQAQTGGDPKNKRVSSKTLRTRWSKANNKPWPKDPKDPTRNQDVSHTKPLADGGDNSVEDIKPLPHEEHVKQHIQKGDFSRWRRK